MWLTCIVSFSMFFIIRCSEFFIDYKECLLLSHTNNFKVVDLSSGNSAEKVSSNTTAYVSLCPRKLPKTSCPTNSLVCLVDGIGKGTDIGSNITSITHDSEQGLFVLHLKSKYGNGLVYITCDMQVQANPILTMEDMQDTKEIPETGGIYHYSIMWISAESCPRKRFIAINNCFLYTKDIAVDLRPLQYFTDYVTDHDSEKRFIVNICKNVSHESCPPSTVCVIDKKIHQGRAVAKAEGSVLSYVERKWPVLTYKNLQGKGKTVIRFTCSVNTTYPVMKFDRIDEGSYFFNMHTSVVCPIRHMDCLILDHNKEFSYDLTSLYQSIGNWQEMLESKHMIIFNFCSSLNYISHIPCTAGNYLACVVDERNKTIAFAYDSKVEASSGNLSVILSGDTVDHKKFFLIVNITCWKNNDIYNTTHDSEHNYTIFMKSPAACPSQIDKGSDCKVRNLFTNTTVDVNALHNDNEDYHLQTSNGTYRINICGYLKESCSKNEEASICFKNKHGTEIAIGERRNDELIFKDGNFMLQLQGEPCNKNAKHSKVIIILLCIYFERDTIQQSKPEYFSETNDCEYHFIWRTNLVCQNHISTNCSLNVGNNLFNLTALKNLKENYVVPLDKDTKVVLNICHSLIQEDRMRCSILAGACMINSSYDYLISSQYKERKKSENLGLVSEIRDLEYVNGSLRILYGGGGVCSSGDHGSISTNIQFECNETATDTSPIFKGFSKCEYTFLWISKAACPVITPVTNIKPLPSITPEPERAPESTTTPNKEDIHKILEKKRGECAVTYSETNKRFDLSTIMNRSWKVKNSSITIAICQPISNSLCHENSGACSYTYEIGFKNLGDYNFDLKYEEESLYLEYKTYDGLSTKIEFVCSNIDLGPKYIEEKGLETFLSWPTPLACIEEVESNCCHKIKELCDFYNETYEVVVNQKTSAFLSLCKPVIPKLGLLCTNSSPACIASRSPDNAFSNGKVIGKIRVPPLIHKDSLITVDYTGGSICDHDLKTKYSTRITFFCNTNASKVYPRFQTIQNKCQYLFDWGSPLLCRENKSEEKKNCKIFGKNSNITSDALRINKLVGLKGQYIIDLCSPSPKCNGHICKSVNNGLWKNFGMKNKTIFSTSKVNFYYSFPSETKNDECGANVEILCDTSLSSLKDPVLEKETECFIHVILKHKLACLPVNQIDTEPEKASSALAWIIFIFIVIILIVIIGLYWMKRRRNGLSPSMSKIFRYKKINNNVISMEDDLDETALLELIRNKEK